MAERLKKLPDDPKIGWWVTGLVDGEGCFFASVSFRTKTTPAGNDVPCVNVDVGLQVWLRADDVIAIHKIHEYFGCGFVQKKRVNGWKSRSNIKANPGLVFRLFNLEDIVSVVIPHFDKFPLQGKKARDYEVWKEIVLFIYSNLRGKKGWLRRFPEKVVKISDLCERLKDTRIYDPHLAALGGI